MAAAAELLIDDPTRLEGVTTVGADEHVWRHTRFGDKYVTVVIDLTPTRTKTGPSRLLAVVEGRSKKAFKTWLDAQTEEFRDHVEVVAMDGFTGYKNAAVEAIDTVKIVMDPGLLRRPSQPLAARDQREHQRATSPVLPQGN